MAETYYKKYARENRVQATEETFKDGQVFTRAPLASDKARLLVNYDFSSDEESLVTRKGLQTKMIGMNTSMEVMSKGKDVMVHDMKEVSTEDGKHYRLVVTSYNNADDKFVENTDLKEVTAELNVIDMQSEGDTRMAVQAGISTHHMYSIPLSHAAIEETSKAKSYVKTFDSVFVHGMHLNDATSTASKMVGCFAMDNNYYCFNNKGELIRSKYVVNDTATTHSMFVTEKLEPKQITPAMATSYGFNMLLNDPYTFSDTVRDGQILFDGMLLYKDGKLVSEALVAESYTIRAYYLAQAGKKYKLYWDYKELSSETWVKLKTEDFTANASTKPKIELTEFKSPYESVSIRLRAYAYDSSGNVKDSDTDLPERELTLPLTFVKLGTANKANREMTNYDMSKVSGMTYWKNFIWFYGLAEAPRVLFRSNVNDPAYIPYPNGVDVYDEEIITCVPFNEALLVFTATNLYKITVNSGTFKRELIQANLSFSDIDANFVQVVKNMVFFKSGEYYYMIVPKQLSLQNELALAPVSKNINFFIDEFYDNVKQLLDIMYDKKPESLNLVAHYNYLDYEDVKNVYTFKYDEGVLFNLMLVYNTVNRTWRTHIYETSNIIKPLRQDATKQCTLVMASPAHYSKEYIIDEDTYILQFLEENKTGCHDAYITEALDMYISTNTNTGNTEYRIMNLEEIKEDMSKERAFPNWQMFDSGYRDNSLDYKKRFRELQLKFNNVSSHTLRFTTEFVLDGETRVGRFIYTTNHITDPTDPHFGLITIDRTPVENMEVPGVTIFPGNGTTTEVNCWTLDSSAFPEIDFWKARLKVSGKGYTPRFRLISKNEESYELLGYTWVYRLMYSR